MNNAIWELNFLFLDVTSHWYQWEAAANFVRKFDSWFWRNQSLGFVWRAAFSDQILIKKIAHFNWNQKWRPCDWLTTSQWVCRNHSHWKKLRKYNISTSGNSGLELCQIWLCGLCVGSFYPSRALNGKLSSLLARWVRGCATSTQPNLRVA